ncbi:MAG TPA: SIR2 family protein [Blastocatellia bacterium]|nr:SIR2 family protein [Blastocatellia bacterium]
MSGPEYLNLTLKISRHDEVYKAELDCPSGKSTTFFQLPVSDQELNAKLARIRKPGPNARASRSVEVQTARDFGVELFKSVFDKESLSNLRDCIAQAAESDCGLRVRLMGCDEVIDLPWEYLYDMEHESYLFASPDYLLMRYYNNHISREILPLAIKPALRVLVMIPNEGSSPDAETEWNLLNASLSSQRSRGLVTLERLQPATLSALKLRLERSPMEDGIHAFHFIGRVKFDDDSEEPALMIDADSGNSDLITAGHLGCELYNHQPLRLAVLIGRNHSEAGPLNLFGASARSLLERRVSSAITTQLEMTPEAGRAFAAAFYATLAAGRPVDAAMAEGRNAVSAGAGLLQSSAPVLYTRVMNGRLFARDEAAPHSPSVLKSTPSAPDDGNLGEHFSMMAHRIKEGLVIPFLGAGASLCGRPENTDWDPARRDYLPDSSQLTSYLIKQLYPLMPQESKGDLLRASQFICLEMGETPLYQKLHSVFALPYQPTPLHTLLAEIPCILSEKGYAPFNQLVLTTNYDNLMERAFDRAGIKFDLIYYESKNLDKHFGKLCRKNSDGTVQHIEGEIGYQDISPDRRSVILKIHGAVHEMADQDSYVITEDDYIDYLTHTALTTLFPVDLIKKIKESHFLFLGYKLRDWNLRAILRQIEVARKLSLKSWAIQRAPDRIDTAMWRNHGVEIIDMDLEKYVDRLSKALQSLPRSGDD